MIPINHFVPTSLTKICFYSVLFADQLKPSNMAIKMQFFDSCSVVVLGYINQLLSYNLTISLSVTYSSFGSEKNLFVNVYSDFIYNNQPRNMPDDLYEQIN